MSSKAIAVAGLSAIAIAAGGCSGDSDPEEGSPPVDSSNLTTFVSARNGYSFKLPRGLLTPAKELWDPVNQPPLAIGEWNLSTAHRDQFDFVETGFAAAFHGASTVIPDGVPVDEWVDASVAKYLPGRCHAPRSEKEEITIDGQPGRISECPNQIVATVAVDGRLYFFMMEYDPARPGDARADFDAFAATIDLRPETAGEAESPPATTTEQVETQPPAQSAVNIARFRGAFKKRFATAPSALLWYHHITGMKMARHGTTLLVATDLAPPESKFWENAPAGWICHAAVGFAFDHEVGDGIEAVSVRGSDGVGLGSCG